MAANVEAMVREGVAAFKEGRNEEARVLLSKAVELDQYNEQAWLWLSGVVESPEDQRVCLENVLAINPLNERAKKGLAHLNGQSVDFAPPKPPPPPRPETSVEWDTGSDSKPRSSTPGAISDEEYDNWVTNLNLTPGAAGAAAVPGASSPFTDVNFDEFDDGPFRELEAAANAAPVPQRRTFDFAAPAPALSTSDFEAISPAMPGQNAKDRKRASREQRRAQAEAKRASGERSIKRNDAGLFIPEPDERDYTLIDDIDGDGDGVPMEAGEGELFAIIPMEIRPTRLPGTRERLPVLGILMLIALIVINLGAFVVLAIQLVRTFNPA